MTELQALNKSIKLWKWLVKNFPARKRRYPDYQKIEDYLDGCPLCEKYKYLQAENECVGCCLYTLKNQDEDEGVCCEYFYIWANSHCYEEKEGLKAAEKILSTMIKRRDKIRKT